MHEKEQERVLDRIASYRLMPVRAPNDAGKEERRLYAGTNAAKAAIYAGATAFAMHMLSPKFEKLSDGDFSLNGLAQKGAIIGIPAMMALSTAISAWYMISDLE